MQASTLPEAQPDGAARGANVRTASSGSPDDYYDWQESPQMLQDASLPEPQPNMAARSASLPAAQPKGGAAMVIESFRKIRNLSKLTLFWKPIQTEPNALCSSDDHIPQADTLPELEPDEAVRGVDARTAATRSPDDHNDQQEDRQMIQAAILPETQLDDTARGIDMRNDT